MSKKDDAYALLTSGTTDKVLNLILALTVIAKTFQEDVADGQLTVGEILESVYETLMQFSIGSQPLYVVAGKEVTVGNICEGLIAFSKALGIYDTSIWIVSTEVSTTIPKKTTSTPKKSKERKIKKKSKATKTKK